MGSAEISKFNKIKIWIYGLIILEIIRFSMIEYFRFVVYRDI